MVQEESRNPLQHIDTKVVDKLKKNPLEPLRQKLKEVELELLMLSDKLLSNAKAVPQLDSLPRELMAQTEEDGKVCLYVDEAHTRHVDIELTVEKPARGIFKSPTPAKATIHILDDVGNPPVTFSYHVGPRLHEEHFTPLLQSLDKFMLEGDYFEPAYQLRIVQCVAQVMQKPDLVPAYIRRQQRRYCTQANTFVTTHLEHMRGLTQQGAQSIRDYLTTIEQALCDESLNNSLDVVIAKAEAELQAFCDGKKKEWEQENADRIKALEKRQRELDDRETQQKKTGASLQSQSDRLEQQRSFAAANDQRASLFDRYELDALTMDRLAGIFPDYEGSDYSTRIDSRLRTFYGLQLERHCADENEQSHALDCMHMLRIACVGQTPTASDFRDCYRATRALMTYTRNQGKSAGTAISELRQKAKSPAGKGVREFIHDVLGIDLCLEPYDRETHHD